MVDHGFWPIEAVMVDLLVLVDGDGRRSDQSTASTVNHCVFCF